MKYKSESSINKLLAKLQIAGAAVEQDKDEESFEVLLREALQSENEAIKIYIKLKEKSESLGSSILVKAFDELKEDETKHVGNLQYLMKLLCQSTIDIEQSGELEEQTMQMSTSKNV